MPLNKSKNGKPFFYVVLAAGALAAVVLMKGNLDIRSGASSYLPIIPREPTTAPTFQPRQTLSPRLKPSPIPTLSPTPVPAAVSCGSVQVTGASYAGIVNGKSLYYIASGASATLNANVVPTNGAVNWKIVSYSSRLSNGGKFSVNNNPRTVYTASINTSGSDQGVEVRGDISEYPRPWIYCPPMTFAVRTQ